MQDQGEITRSFFHKSAPSSGDDPEAIELAFLLQNSAPNDPSVLDRLVNRYAGELYQWVEILVYYRKLGVPSQAEIFDILKRVFGTAIKNVEQFHGKESVSDWLFAIGYQVVRGWKSKRARTWNPQESTNGDDPDDLLPEPETVDQDNLKGIPEKVRSTLILRYLFELALSDLACIVNTQEKDIHHRLIKGRRLLIKNPVRVHAELKIQAFVDGLLDDNPDDLDKLNRHLIDCEVCQQTLHQIETIEETLVENLKKRWVIPALSHELLNGLIQSVIDEMMKPKAGWTIKLPMRQTAWILGLALMLAGFAIISIRSTPAEKEIAQPEITPTQQLPPIVEMQQYVGLSQNRFDVPSAPQYIAPAFSSDGKWAVFAATNYSLNAQSLMFQTIDVYNRDANTIQVISESSAFINSWVWWDLAPSISGDGRWIVYVSTMKELHVSGYACSTEDHRDCLDIFLYDRISGVTKRLTQAVNGGAANGDSLAPTISEDGQWVVFWSTADNLVEGFKNTCEQNGTTIACLYIYLYNVATGKTSWIPIRTIPGDNVYGVDRISLSADARYIGFTVASSAQAGIPSLGSPFSFYNQGGLTGNAIVDTYIPDILHSSEAILYDRETDKYELQNQNQAGVPGDGPSSSPVISTDGRYVAFVSASTNLVTGDDSNYSDIFVRDRETGKIEIVSVSSTGQNGNADSGYNFSLMGYYSLNISEDGRYVVFVSLAGNLGVIGNQDCNRTDNINCHYLYIHDRQTGTTEGISALTKQDFTLFPDVSSDGRWISFMQYFHNCSTAQSQCANVMLYDKHSNWTTNLTKYDVETPRLPWSYSGSLTLPWETWESTAFALSPDSSMIALGGNDSIVRIWQIAYVKSSILKGEPVKIIETTGNDSFSSLAFSPNGEWLAGGTTSGTIYVWQSSDGKILYSIKDQPNLVRNLVFTKDGSELVISTLHEAWTWRLGDNQMYPVDGFSATMTDAYVINISPKGDMIASARRDGTVWLQSLPDGKVIARLGTNRLSARSLAFSSDGSLLAALSPDGTLTLWQIAGKGRDISSIRLVNNYKSSGATGELAFSPDNKFLAGSRTAGEISLWSIPDGKVFTLSSPVTQGILYSLVFGAGGDKLAALFESEIALWGIPKDSSSTFYVHAASDNYVDAKPFPESSANDIAELQSPDNSVRNGNLSLEQATKLLSFPLMVPIHLPENIRFNSAFVNMDGSVLLFYEMSDQDGYQALLCIYEKNIKNSDIPTMTIGEDASVRLTQVNTIVGNAPAEYVQGDWIWRMSFTPATDNSPKGVTHDVWDWDSSSSTERLRWKQNDILIGLYYQIYKPYSPVMDMSNENDKLFHLSSILDQGDLEQIASWMVPYSEVNTVKISFKRGGNYTNELNSMSRIGIDQLYPTALSEINGYPIKRIFATK